MTIETKRYRTAKQQRSYDAAKIRQEKSAYDWGAAWLEEERREKASMSYYMSWRPEAVPMPPEPPATPMEAPPKRTPWQDIKHGFKVLALIILAPLVVAFFIGSFVLAASTTPLWLMLLTPFMIWGLASLIDRH